MSGRRLLVLLIALASAAGCRRAPVAPTRSTLDRVELIRNALAGQAPPATQLVPPRVFGYNAQIQETAPDLSAARAGIRVTVDAMPKSRYFSYLKTETWSFFLLGWVCSTLFGGDALEVLIRTRGSGGQGDFNYQGIHERSSTA